MDNGKPDPRLATQDEPLKCSWCGDALPKQTGADGQFIPCQNHKCREAERMEARLRRTLEIKERLGRAGIPIDLLADLIWYSLEGFVMERIGPLVKQHLSSFVADEIRRQLSRMQIFIPEEELVCE